MNVVAIAALRVVGLFLGFSAGGSSVSVFPVGSKLEPTDFHKTSPISLLELSRRVSKSSSTSTAGNTPASSIVPNIDASKLSNITLSMMESANYHTDNGVTVDTPGVMTAGIQYTPGTGYSFATSVNPTIPTSPEQLGWQGGGVSTDLQSQFMNFAQDASFGRCADDATDPACEDARQRIETTMVQMLDANGKAIPAVVAEMINFWSQLGVSEAQLSVLSSMVNGDSGTTVDSSSGLAYQMQKLLAATLQMYTQMSGAYEVVSGEIVNRGNMFATEPDRLEKLASATGLALQNAISKVTSLNTQKGAKMISQQYGEVLGGLNQVSEDASFLADSANQTFASSVEQIADFHSGNDAAIAAIPGVVSSISQAAKTNARTIESGFLSSEQAVLAEANSQGIDFSGIVDSGFDQVNQYFGPASEKALNKTIANNAQNVNGVQLLFGPMNQTLFDQLDKLSDDLASNTDGANSDLNNTLTDIFTNSSTLLHNANLKQIYYSQSIQDLAKLQADAASGSSTLHNMSTHSMSALDALMQEGTADIAAKSTPVYLQFMKDVSDGIGGISGDIDNFSNSAANSANALVLSSDSGATDLKASSGANAMDVLNGLQGTSSAVDKLKSLQSAQLQFLGDQNSAVIAGNSRVYQSAMADANSVLDDLLTSANKNSRDLASSMGNALLTSAGKAQTQTTNVAAQMNGLFQSILGDVRSAGRGTSDEATDAKSAMGAASLLRDNVQSQIKDSQSDIDSGFAEQTNSLQQLTNYVNTSSAWLNGTQSTASTQFNARTTSAMSGVSDSLNAYVADQRNKSSQSLYDLQAIVDEKGRDQSKFSKTVHATYDPIVVAVNTTIDELQQALSSPTGSLDPVLYSVAQLEAANLQKKLGDLINSVNSQGNSVVQNLSEMLNQNVSDTIGFLQSYAGNATQRMSTYQSAVSDLQAKAQATLWQLLDQKAFSEALSNSAQNKINSTQYSMTDATNQAQILDNTTRTNASNAKQALLGYLSSAVTNLTSAAANGNLSGGDLLSNVTHDIKDSTSAFSSGIQDIQSSVGSVFDKILKFENDNHSKYMQTLMDMVYSVLDAKFNISQSAVYVDLQNAAKAGSLNTIVANYMNAVNIHQQNVTDFYSFAKEQISLANKFANGNITQLTEVMNSTFHNLNTTSMQSALDQEQFLQSLFNQYQPSLSSGAAALQTVQDSLDSTNSNFNNGIANQTGSMISLSGLWSKLSAQSKYKLAGIVEKLRQGSVSFQQAMDQAHTVNVNDIQSGADAVQALSNMVSDYQMGVENAFSGSQQRLEQGMDGINDTITSATPDLLGRLDRAESLLNQTQAQIDAAVSNSATMSNPGESNNSNPIMDQVTDLQNQIQDAQNNITQLVATSIQPDVDQLERDMQSSEQYFENYLDGLANRAVDYVANKASTLKQKLGLNNTATSAAGSLLQNMSIHELQRATQEIKELNRRHLLRAKQSTQLSLRIPK